MSIGDGKYAPVDEMTPEVHAYWEGRAESSAEIQSLKDALREADCPHADSDYKSIRRNGGWYCFAGDKATGTSFYKLEEPCPWCANRDELLGETV